MDREQIEIAAAGLADTLTSIEAGTLEATPSQQAYIAGALHGLRAVLGEVELSAKFDS